MVNPAWFYAIKGGMDEAGYDYLPDINDEYDEHFNEDAFKDLQNPFSDESLHWASAGWSDINHGKSDSDRRKEHYALIKKTFKSKFNREPSSDELKMYSDAIFAKQINSPADLEADLMSQPEYAQIHGGEGEEGMGEYSAQEQFDIYSEFAPQYAQKQAEIIADLYPYQSGLGEIIGKQVSDRLSKETYEIPEWMSETYKRSRREADSSRGLVNSGMSGRAEAEDLSRLGYDLYQSDINTGMALYGGIPKAAPMGSVPGQTPDLSYQTAQAQLKQNQKQFDATQAYDTQVREDEREYQESQQPNPWIDWVAEEGVDLVAGWSSNKWGSNSGGNAGGNTSGATNSLTRGRAA